MAPLLDLCRVERVEKLSLDPGSVGVAPAVAVASAVAVAIAGGAEPKAGAAGVVGFDGHPAFIEFVPVA